MKIFKIQRTSDNLFSKGGTRLTFTKKGKLWSALGHVTSHLNYVSYKEAQGLILIEYDINEADGSMAVVQKTSLVTVKQEADARRKVREEKQKIARLKYEIELAEKQKQEASKRFALAEQRLQQLKEVSNGKRT
jgi:uncharacterized protein YxjI